MDNKNPPGRIPRQLLQQVASIDNTYQIQDSKKENRNGNIAHFAALYGNLEVLDSIQSHCGGLFKRDVFLATVAYWVVMNSDLKTGEKQFHALEWFGKNKPE